MAMLSRLTSTVWRAAVAEQWLMFLGAAIFMVGDSQPALESLDIINCLPGKL